MGKRGHAVAGSGGIVLGVAQKLDEKHQVIPEYHIDGSQKADEWHRFEQAVAQACDALKSEMQTLEHHQHADSILPILQTHLLLLQDPELHSRTRHLIQSQSINVEWALKQVLSDFIQAFAHMEDMYLQSRKADVEQVGQRILSALDASRVEINQSQSILIATDFSPSDVVSMWRSGVAGFVATQGGKDSHAMIVARGVGLTGLAGAQGLFEQVKDGDTLILDGEKNIWVLRPSAQEVADFEAQQQRLSQEQQALQAYAHQASISKDGYHLPLLANIEFVEEVDVANSYGIDGIGLFRTEFLFMQSDTLPTEDEQAAYYQAVAKRAQGKPITFRLLDVGADKLAHVQALFGAYDGENPALGLRGVRMLLHKPDILKAQLRAMLTCVAYAPVSVLVPMVIAADEMQAVRKYLDEAKKALRVKDDVALGCMIEVPAAALIAQDLAEVSDFFSIGSNDLVQYGLAVDRGDEHVGHLYDADHPAIRTLIRMAVDAASAKGIPVTVCGELAANTAWTQTFLDMGVSALSMTARHVLPVRKKLKQLQAKA